MGIWMDEVNDMTNEVEALRARAESAEADLAAARADLSALAAVVGSAVVAGALAPGESLSQPSGHIIVSTVSGLRARAEAAERRAEALEAALAQARADARTLVGVAYGLEECCWVEDRLVPAGLTDTEIDAVESAHNDAFLMTNAEVVAVIRRALGARDGAAALRAEVERARAEAAEAAPIRRVLHHEGTAVRGSPACVAAAAGAQPAGEVGDG